MFKPKWKKQAKLLLKGAKKFINYKRDLLSDDRIDEIIARRADLKKALKSGDKETITEAAKLLEKTCDQALPHNKPTNAFQENIEVFFVAIVVALGIRAYFLQPFRIPTNSMYPTLNGLVGKHLAKDKWPALPVRLAQMVTHGRSYIDLKADKNSYITDIKEGTLGIFLTRTTVTFSSGQKVTLSCSASSLLQTGMGKKLAQLAQNQGIMIGDIQQIHPQVMQILRRIPIPAGTILAEGYVDSGDLILVDKVSWHFTRPVNGEVIVFDTRGIKKIEAENRKYHRPNSHYIKRLIGSPGDTIHLEPSGYPSPPDNAIIVRNGQAAQEPGILRVQSHKDGYHGYSFMGYLQRGKSVTLKSRPNTGKSEYWAMGDNSYHSSDSRDWGTVKEYNLVGPAFFSLWPFGSGHWGIIR